MTGGPRPSIHLAFCLLALRIVCSAPTARAGSASPNELVNDFVLAISNLDFLAYESTLDDDFIFYFRPEDVDRVPGGVPWWDRASELTAVQRIFSGQPGTSPNGDLIPAVQSISVVAHLIEDWLEESDLMRSRWLFDIVVFYAGGDFISDVQSIQDMYAIQRGSDWRIFAAWEVAPAFKGAVETSSWGLVKLGFAEIVVPTAEEGWSELKSRW